MAATNFTPIILYHTTTASAAPTAGNLNNGELAINITDGKLFYKDNGGTVQVIATKGTGTIGGSNTQVQYNSSGALAGSANFTFNGTTATINTLNLTNALGTAYGGTALTTYTQGDLVYASAANTLAKLGIGANTYILTSTGSVPQWSAPSAITVSTATNLAGGAAGSVPYQSGASTTTFLSIGSAGQILSSTGSAPQWSSPAALTKTDDTNVTLTLGGSASTALVNAASLTLGWTGQLSIARGGTNATATPTAGAVAYGTGTAYAFTAAGTSGQVLTSNGAGVPTWASLSSIGVTTFSAGTTGFTPSTATSGAITLAGTLATTNGGTGLTSFTANGVVYASSSSALTTGSALTFDGTTLSASAGTPVIRATASTTTALYGLEFNGGALDAFVKAQPNSSELRIASGRSAGWGGFTSFYIDTAEAMRLTSTGLGIGTSSPTTKVTSVYGLSAAINGASPNATTALTLAGGDTTVSAGSGTLLQFRGIIARGGVTAIGGVYEGTNKDGSFALAFYRNSGNGTIAEAMRLDSSGNLGIGTSSPASTLDVRTSTGATIIAGRTSNVGATSQPGALNFTAPNASGSSRVWAGLRAVVGTATAGSESSSLIFSNQVAGAYTDTLTIDSSGNLGLGVTPSAWGRVGFEIGVVGAAITRDTRDLVLLSNAYWASGGLTYAANAAAGRFDVGVSGFKWYTATSGTAGNLISFTQALTLTANRNLLVNTTTENSGNGGLKVNGQFALASSQAFTASGSVNNTAYYVVCYSLSGTCTLTLPTPADNTGRLLNIVVQSNQQVVSASSNVTAITDGALTTSILPATAGKWAQLWCDGTYWNIIATNV